MDGKLDSQFRFDPNLVTEFFEADAGAILGGIEGDSSPFEFPFTVGLVPLLFQNGVWMQDAVNDRGGVITTRRPASPGGTSIGSATACG